jgi:membrane-bound lytic murein transglycosylase A
MSSRPRRDHAAVPARPCEPARADLGRGCAADRRGARPPTAGRVRRVATALALAALTASACSRQPSRSAPPSEPHSAPAPPGAPSARDAGDARDDAPDAAAPDETRAAPDDAAPCPRCPAAAVDPEGLATSPSVRDRLTLARVAFAELPGWSDDRHAEALPAVLASCARLDELADDAPLGVDGNGGRARHWRALCRGARRVPAGDDAAAKALFERELRPYAASGRDGRDGKMTGYYVQALRGSRRRHGRYQVPIYGRPSDLVVVDLAAFLPDARGRRIWGRYDAAKGAVVRFPTRAEIRRGALRGQGLEILWVDDRVDALFAQIQGSGKVALDDGTEQWIEFAGKNGRAYRGVGKILRERGEPPGTGTMQGIRAYFAAHPEQFDEIADQNESFVFFGLSRKPGAIGSQGVVLTPRRSMAVDRAFIAASTPIWVETRAPDLTGKVRPWRQLLVAQDTGEGIRGAVRGDIYWGHDAEATEIAGHMGGKGRYWLLLPRRLPVAAEK